MCAKSAKSLKSPEPRRALDAVQAYVPGEQPQGRGGFIKLNTNENPYPPPTSVKRALEDIDPERLPRYPDPLCVDLRKALARPFDLSIDETMVGNGSDELLRYICNAYLERGDTVATLDPTYSLYETLVAIFEGDLKTFPVSDDELLPDQFVKAKAKIAFLSNPNPPFGEFYGEEEVRRLIEHDPRRLIVLDEAYVDFAIRNFVELVREYPNVIVTRTYSKSCSLAGARLGYAFAPPELLAPLYKIKDSYNVSLMTQTVGLAALKSPRHLARCNARVIRDREWLRGALGRRGFEVSRSQANFVFARHPQAKSIYKQLKKRRIYVRWFDRPGLSDGLRITIGTRRELQVFMVAVDEILEKMGK